MTAVDTYSQLMVFPANTYAAERWNATAWKRKTVLKLTNMLIHPATSLWVLKNTPESAAAAPWGCDEARWRNARRCAYIRDSIGSGRISSGTETSDWTRPSSWGIIAANRSGIQKNSLKSSYITLSSIGELARPCISLCKN